jgi:hypothetical protein
MLKHLCLIGQKTPVRKRSKAKRPEATTPYRLRQRNLEGILLIDWCLASTFAIFQLYHGVWKVFYLYMLLWHFSTI